MLVILCFWIVSLISGLVLFVFVDNCYAGGTLLGIKVSGAVAAVPLFFTLLFKSYKSISSVDIEIHPRNNFSKKDLLNASFEYSIQDKHRKTKRNWTGIDSSILVNDCFITIPNISFNDYLRVKLKINNETWYSDWVVSKKRHLLFTKETSQQQN